MPSLRNLLPAGKRTLSVVGKGPSKSHQRIRTFTSGPGSYQDSRPDPSASLELPSTKIPAPTSMVHPPSKDKAAESGPLGLAIVYAPSHAYKVDIVFVHGFGGTSRWTWTKNKDPNLFWPMTFLPLEPDICEARIMTFGYSTAFQKASSVTTLVLDFAKDLLFDLKYAKDQDMEALQMGKMRQPRDFWDITSRPGRT